MQTLYRVFVWLVVDSLVVDSAEENEILIGIKLACFLQAGTWPSSRPCDDMGLITHDGCWVVGRLLDNKRCLADCTPIAGPRPENLAVPVANAHTSIISSLKFFQELVKHLVACLNTAFAAMKKLKLRDPIIRQSSNSVVVDIRHQRLGSPEEIIMEYLETNDEISICGCAK
jgi:hypothetical protein